MTVWIEIRDLHQFRQPWNLTKRKDLSDYALTNLSNTTASQIILIQSGFLGEIYKKIVGETYNKIWIQYVFAYLCFEKLFRIYAG